MSLNISDIETSVRVKTLIKDAFFRDGKFQTKSNGSLVKYTGGYSVVFPCDVNGSKWAFRCWYVPITDAFNRYKQMTTYFKSIKTPYFSDIHYCEKGIVVNGQTYPTIRMKWVDGKLLKDYIKENISNKDKLRDLSDKFLEMCKSLNSKHIAHGDLQHGNIMVNNKGELRLLDYDSVYVPTMGNLYSDVIAGLKDYQHPKRRYNKVASEKLDYFSQVVIYTSLLALSLKAPLAEKYQLFDSESMLFSSEDFDNFRDAQIYSDLVSLKDYRINRCLEILESYLREDDINELSNRIQEVRGAVINNPEIHPKHTPASVSLKGAGGQNVHLHLIREGGKQWLESSSGRHLSGKYDEIEISKGYAYVYAMYHGGYWRLTEKNHYFSADRSVLYVWNAAKREFEHKITSHEKPKNGQSDHKVSIEYQQVQLLGKMSYIARSQSSGKQWLEDYKHLKISGEWEEIRVKYSEAYVRVAPNSYHKLIKSGNVFVEDPSIKYDSNLLEISSHPVKPTPLPKPQLANFCIYCGHKFAPADRYCIICGRERTKI